MMFSSPLFLFIFLPLSMLLYTLFPQRHKKYALLISNVGFYVVASSFQPIAVAVLAVVIIYNYCVGLLIHLVRKKALLYTFVCGNLLFLLLLRLLYIGSDGQGALSYFPLGAAVYLLGAVSYLTDVYRGDVERPATFFELSLYLSFYPVMIAGPIIKYKEFPFILDRRDYNINNIGEGIKLFMSGFVKRLAVAAIFSEILANIITLTSMRLNLLMTLLSILLLFAQFYYTLSSYSDMGRGLALMMGYSLQPDYDYPLAACSVREFAGRFFISLGAWFEDYIYIPMRRSYLFRESPGLPIFICTVGASLWLKTSLPMLLGGVILWVFMLIENKTDVEVDAHASIVRRTLARLFVFVVMCLYTLLLRVDSFDMLFELLYRVNEENGLMSQYFFYTTVINLKYLLLGLISILLMIPASGRKHKGLRDCNSGISGNSGNSGKSGVMLVLSNVALLAMFAFTVLYFMPQFPQYATKAFDYFRL